MFYGYVVRKLVNLDKSGKRGRMKKGQNVYKRKDGRWEARVCIGRTAEGKIRYKSFYAPTYRQAVQRKKDYEIEKVIHPPADEDSCTFLQASQRWIAVNSDDWKQSTLIKYQNYLDHYILPAWGSRQVSEIDQEQYQELIMQLKKSLKESSVSTVTTILKNCLAQVPGGPTITSRQKAQKSTVRQPEVLSAAEIQTLVDGCRQDRDITSLGILIALFEGVRLGELCALRWSDIEPEESIIHIRHTLQRIQNLPENVETDGKTRLLLDSPKNHRERTIPIHPQVMELLLRHKGLYAEDAFVLSGRSQPVEPRTFVYRFKRRCRYLKLRDFKFHSLRHTFATRCIESGMDVKVLSEILGHSSVKITLDRYVHPTMDFKRSQIESLRLI